MQELLDKMDLILKEVTDLYGAVNNRVQLNRRLIEAIQQELTETKDSVESQRTRMINLESQMVEFKEKEVPIGNKYFELESSLLRRMHDLDEQLQKLKAML